MWFLNKFLFKPVLKMLDERNDKITGDFETAEKINKTVDEGLEKLEEEIKNARLESNKIKNEIKDEGSKAALEKLEQAKGKANEYLDKFQKELEANKKEVKKVLEKEIDTIAKSISSMLLGREIN
jgi:F-type H+-transporting ATPase subunit b